MAEKQVIPIYTLSGGVSRQPPSKRTPFQAEDLDNCLVSLERSVEKRPGFSLLPGVGAYDLSFLPTNSDPHFTWFQLDRDNRYLVIINRNAVNSTDKILYVIKVSSTGWTNVTPESQWDPTDEVLQWNGTDPIDPADPRYELRQLALSYGGSDTLLVKYNKILEQGIVSKITRQYLIFGKGKVREVLKSLQIGTNIYYLNTKVYAGFTSGTSGKNVDLSGKELSSDDMLGGKITYYTATRIVKTTDGRMYPQGYSLRDGEEFDPDWNVKFIPVEDYVYGDFEKPWLGQSVRNFGELRFPPDNNDWVANNSRLPSTGVTLDESARKMLRDYYDSSTSYYANGSSPADGRGKIVYCDAPYLSLDAGFYRIVSFPEGEVYNDGFINETGTGKPYTQKVRTPDYCSVIDKARMPQRLIFSEGSFSLSPIEWSARTVGDRVTNPGPSPFLTPEGEARHVQISAISNFRDRMFFSCGDVIFSSQLGILEDLWIKDPSNVTVSDPIDVRAASNNYAEITAMIPFNQYLFVNTKGGIQFELKGENNLISPLTAEISSTTFYSTAELVDPQQLGSQIYFLDKERLYIYLNQDSREFNTAVELSNTVRGYLPENYQDVTTAVSQNYILSVDEDEKNNLYLYCNRFDGNQLIQSAFWRYVINPSDAFYGIKVWDNYLYAAVKRTIPTASSWYLMTNLLEQEDLTIPRMDSMATIQITGGNVTAKAIETTLTVPYIVPQGDCYVVLTSDFGNMSYSVFKANSVSNQGSTTKVVFSGIDLTEHLGKKVWVGIPYTMRIRLSPLFVRDDGNNIIEGMLNLKTMNIRHNNTGTYRVEVTRRGRANKLVSEFSATDLEVNNEIDEDGSFIAKVFGFSDETDIQIINDKLSPCNITQIEVRGVFNRNNSSLR